MLFIEKNDSYRFRQFDKNNKLRIFQTPKRIYKAIKVSHKFLLGIKSSVTFILYWFLVQQIQCFLNFAILFSLFVLQRCDEIYHKFYRINVLDKLFGVMDVFSHETLEEHFENILLFRTITFFLTDTSQTLIDCVSSIHINFLFDFT